LGCRGLLALSYSTDCRKIAKVPFASVEPTSRGSSVLLRKCFKWPSNSTRYG